jgi:carboxymethylenebutenolidase
VTSVEAAWAAHVEAELVTKDVERTLDTMVPDAHVNHVPVMTGGTGRDELREFYSQDFIFCQPLDGTSVFVSRTVGTDTLVDEAVYSFTHSVELPWMLPGVAPTNRRVEVAMCIVVGFRDGKVAHEHIYWDHASVLCQIGLLDEGSLPVLGAESAAAVARWATPAS